MGASIQPHPASSIPGSTTACTGNCRSSPLTTPGTYSGGLTDGDSLRHRLNKNLGFTRADRGENVRRIAEVARLFIDAGLTVLVSTVSPFRDQRRMAWEMIGDGAFIEVFVDAPGGLRAT